MFFFLLRCKQNFFIVKTVKILSSNSETNSIVKRNRFLTRKFHTHLQKLHPELFNNLNQALCTMERYMKISGFVQKLFL